MTTLALAFVYHVNLVLRPTDWPDEIVNWGFHTEECDSFTDLTAAVSDWWATNLDPSFKARVALEAVQISQYIGTKFQLTYQTLYAPPLAGNATATLPPQLATVVTYKTNELGTSLGDASRYNRSFVGYLAAGTTTTNGTLVPTEQVNLVDDFVDLDVDLQALPRFALVTRGGFLVASKQELLAADASIVKVGSVVDTQRRRRNGIPEAYETRNL